MQKARFSRVQQAAIAGLLMSCASVAAGQESTGTPKLALGRFHPSPAGDRMFGVQSPYVTGHLKPYAALLLDYAYNPLVLRSGNGENLGSIVKNQMFLHVNASLSLWNRVQVNVNAPLALVQSGDSPSIDGRTFTSPSGGAFGDLRLGARVRLLGGYYDAFQLGIGTYLWIPTGGGDFVTDGTVRALPQIIAGGRVGKSVYSVALGPELRSSQRYFDAVKQGPMMTGGIGYGYLLGADEQIQVGLEASFSTVFTDPASYNTNAELMASGRYRFLKSFEAAFGVGPGVSLGVGTPQVRLMGMLAYSPAVERAVDSDRDGILDPRDACKLEPGLYNADPKKNGCPPDNDGDGIINAKDGCVDVPGISHPDPFKHGCPSDKDGDGIIDMQDGCADVSGVANPDPKKNGCPSDKDGDGIIDMQDGCADVVGVANPDPKRNGCPPDKDDDGIIDALDACVDLVGVVDVDPAKNGCPPDKDRDGVADAQDACPDLPGLKTKDPATNGCPGDTDGDGIRDDKDACPNEKGAADPDPKQNGCPKSVRVTETEVIILQQVQFDPGRATIKKVSNPLLDELALVMKDHPEFVKLEVQGHTDDRGGKAFNEKLSDIRAKSVMAAIVARGIDASRVTAKGYGQSVPIGDNKTDAGRAKNRRVQFVILEKKPKTLSR